MKTTLNARNAALNEEAMHDNEYAINNTRL